MKYLTVLLLWMLLLSIACSSDSEQPSQLPSLSIADNGRFIQNENGDPFFWLGDTGWLLFRKLTREEAQYYLKNRAGKGFNVIQAMVIHDLNNCTNVNSDSAFIGKDISRPLVTEGMDPGDKQAYDYWDHVDYIVDLAAEYGLYMALVPIWGSNVKSNPVTPEQGSAYGQWLADRYGDRNNVIWLNGGDIRGSDSTAFWNALGNALKSTAPEQLVTFHPFGRTQSSTWFHRASWLDFNMFQSGHRRYDQDDTELAYGEDNWRYVQSDYRLTPVRPTLDGEPSYENIPEGLHDTTQPLWDDADVRRYAYWSVFAGACGFTYGHREVMQFFRPETDNPGYGAILPWREALEAPGASQLVHLKSLMASIPLFSLVPDQTLLAGGQGVKYDHIAACRGDDFAFMYTFNGREMEVAMGKISGEEVDASWYDPRTGTSSVIGSFDNTGILRFDPPGEKEEGNDWVLVLRSLR
jgi:hypothetical protein